MSVWRRTLYQEEAQGMAGNGVRLGVSMQPIGDGKRAGDMVNVQVDLGIGLPFGGLMEWDEATKFAEALKADGWEKDPEGQGGWRL